MRASVKQGLLLGLMALGVVGSVHGQITTPTVEVIGTKEGQSGSSLPSTLPPRMGPRRNYPLPTNNNQPKEKYIEDPLADNGVKPSECGTTVGPSISPATSNPVVIATGEKYKAEPDFGAGSAYGLPLRRLYRTGLPVNVPTLFGLGWTSNYDYPKLRPSKFCTYHQEYGCVPNSASISTNAHRA
jgi:hypothetical protein